jgi:hypothetical protein
MRGTWRKKLDLTTDLAVVVQLQSGEKGVSGGARGRISQVKSLRDAGDGARRSRYCTHLMLMESRWLRSDCVTGSDSPPKNSMKKATVRRVSRPVP